MQTLVLETSGSGRTPFTYNELGQLGIGRGMAYTAQEAALEIDLKMRMVMKRLLVGNDIKGDKVMRENILEQMNDLRRFAQACFQKAGILDAGDRSKSWA